MRMRNLMAAGAAALSCVAVPAMAQETDDRAFNGFYFGGHFGYTVQNNDRDERIEFDAGRDGTFGDVVRASDGSDYFANGFCNGSATSRINVACRNDKDDIEYGGRVGVDRQMGKFVLGVVGEFGETDATDSIAAFSIEPDSYTMTRTIDWNAAIRLRAGVVAGKSTLFYATGGASYAKIDRYFSTTNTDNARAYVSNSKEWGWQAGGGIEQKLGRNFSIGLEYLYSRYKDKNSFASIGTTPLANIDMLPETNTFVQANGVDMRRNNPFDYHSMRLTAQFRF